MWIGVGGALATARDPTRCCRPCAPAANCTKCGNDHAYYQQLQIRSADEPMTTFYKCTACGLRWRED